MRASGWLLGVLLLCALALPITAFGLEQLARTARAQLDGPAAVTDFVAYYGGAQVMLWAPDRLYETATQRAVQRDVQAGRDVTVPYVSPPYVALVQAPLALLPFGAAYLLWLGLGVACFAAAAYLLAPRPWPMWLLGALLYVPMLFGLIMGQTACIMLLGFSIFARWPTGRGSLGLLGWTFKPNLMPAYLVALVMGRRWRALAALSAGLLLLVALSLLLIGPAGILDFVRAALVRWNVETRRGGGYSEGLALLTLAQDVLGAGRGATVAGVLASLVVCGLVGYLWRGGLGADARRDLQLAALPIAASLASLHAGVYEMTTWLASAWLLVRYAGQVPSARSPVLGMTVAWWCIGCAAVVGPSNLFVDAAVCSGLVALGGIMWLYCRHTSC